MTTGDSFSLRTKDGDDDTWCLIEGEASFPDVKVLGPGETGAYDEDPVVSIRAQHVQIGESCTGNLYGEITGHMTKEARYVRVFTPDGVTSTDASSDACLIDGRTVEPCWDSWVVRIVRSDGSVVSDFSE